MNSVKTKVMLQKIIYALSMVVAWTCRGSARETWSLEKCVQHALDNSLSIKQSVLSLNEAGINKRMANQDDCQQLMAVQAITLVLVGE